MALASSVAGDDEPANQVALALYRLDETVIFAPWAMTVIVELDLVPDAKGVVADAPDGTAIELEPDASDEAAWSGVATFPTLEAMLAFAGGEWEIDVSAGESTTSTTRFSLTTTGLVDDDFYAVPEILQPANGSADVPADSPFVWTDPNGPDPVEAIVIDVDSDGAGQQVDSITGSIDGNSTTWTPTEPLNPGVLTTAGIFHVRFADASRISPYEVVSGAIDWSDAVPAPKGYPANAPRFNWGSAAVTAFVAVGTGGTPGDVDGDGVVNGSDLTRVLSAWGACAGCPEDLDGNGVVDGSDLTVLLSNWS